MAIHRLLFGTALTAGLALDVAAVRPGIEAEVRPIATLE
jgi:hypothetical protein